MKLVAVVFILILNLGYSFSQEIVDSFAISKEVVVYFESDSYQIPDSSILAIHALVLETKNIPNFKIKIHAHTDDVGSDSYNKRLSKLRKDAVVDKFIGLGVSDTLINSNYHGEQLRVALGNDKLSRQKNRRAIIQLITPKKYGYIKGHVISEDSNDPIKAEVVLSSKLFENKTLTNDLGHFKILAPLGEFVVLEFVSLNHFIKSEALKVTRDLLVKPMEIPMIVVELGKSFTFENMLFLGNRSRMLRRSERVMYHLNRFMYANPDVCIEIAGHINLPSQPKVKRETAHFELSVARSLEVKDELLKNGISADRLLSKGYGNWYMVYPNANTLEQQEENRRVEIIIMHCDSTVQIQDDSIPFPERYKEVGINRMYNSITVKTDLETAAQTTKDKLILQLKQMKKASLDPTIFTYRELITAYPEIPDIRNK